MMKQLLTALLLSLAAMPALAGPGFITLAFHDVTDTPSADPYAVTQDRLVALFDFLVGNDFRPVSVDDLIAAREGRRPLPDKAVLLTFDDGLRSTYSKVFPLLKAYQFPAVVAVVGSWLEVEKGPVAYGDTPLDRSQLLSWSELAEMQASGLVEIASHSFDLHRGIAANPQGDPQPAAVTRAYDAASARYENDLAYRQRIREDLARNSTLLAQRLGKRPRVMVWPYGAHSSESVAIAQALGMEVTLTLLEGAGRLDRLQQVPRHLALNNPTLQDWLYSLRTDKPRRPMRAMHVDLDYVYDADPIQQRRNLDALLERVKAFAITHVFLQAYADPDGDGVADALYFPNRHLPVRADLFSHVAWRLYTRSQVEVFAWMPMLAFALPDAERSARLAVQAIDRPATDPGDYHRLSPFLPESKRLITDIYADLGRHSSIKGLLFHDDGYLRDYEDAHAPGLSAAQKTQALVKLSHTLADAVRHYRPDIKTARNLYARLVLQPKSEAWFAQSLPAFLEAYDYTAVMAMPGLEGVQGPAYGWLEQLAARALSAHGAQEKLLFELQSVDWQRKQPIPTEQLIRQLRVLAAAGIRHLGYYPDDFIADHPRMGLLKGIFSAADFPYQRP